ncbi:hypothetical protein [Chitinophaga filiformis]|uniref:Lipocalin-like domain-containing protein n=1 Tax=Chitinophaga filiformis TaxID=104663 RepID=A0A1G7SQG3_CHIFI|nr:hypothetical protein [Chitinophaga filiformis]SDG25191.1 hypothetical protein SAMN04488121_103968 [Chitinophaga filiformis]
MKIRLQAILSAVILALVFSACNSGSTNKLLLHKKWRVYDVVIPPGSAYDITQINQATDLKRGYYTNVFYQFLDNNLFIATIDNKPDSGKYKLLSDGKVISVTAANGLRSAENLVTVVNLDETHFDMKVKSGDYYFILKTKSE